MNKPHENAVGLEDVKGVLAWMLWIVHAITRTVQVYARRPGTCGVAYFGPTLWLGQFVMLTVPHMFMPPDPVSMLVPDPVIPQVYGIVIFSAGILQVWHFLATMRNRFRGRVIHSYDKGIPIFLPKPGKGTMDSARMGSDLFMCGMIAWGCFTAEVPTLGVWFLFVVPVNLFLSHALLVIRTDRRIQAVDDAAIEGQAMNDHVEGRYDQILEQQPSQPDDFQSLLQRNRRND